MARPPTLFRHPARSEAERRDPGGTKSAVSTARAPALGPGSALRAVRDDERLAIALGGRALAGPRQRRVLGAVLGRVEHRTIVDLGRGGGGRRDAGRRVSRRGGGHARVGGGRGRG
ncbi:MAG: hypothetical protein EON95_19730, partial [Caulobacteraceae bacterium]